MTMELWETADKYTILRVKQEKGLDVSAHYEMYRRATLAVPADLLEQLYEVNKAMFEMEEVLSFAFERGEYEMAGHLYHSLRGLTHLRTKAKHAIARACGESLEVKRYGKGY